MSLDQANATLGSADRSNRDLQVAGQFITNFVPCLPRRQALVDGAPPCVQWSTQELSTLLLMAI